MTKYIYTLSNHRNSAHYPNAYRLDTLRDAKKHLRDYGGSLVRVPVGSAEDVEYYLPDIDEWQYPVGN